MDGSALWRTSDPVEAMFLQATAQRLAPLRAQEREDQATRTVNALARAMK